MPIAAVQRERGGGIADHLESVIGPVRYERYFRKAVRLELTQGRLLARVPTRFYAAWLERTFGDSLREAVRRGSGADLPSIEWQVDAEQPAPATTLGDAPAEAVTTAPVEADQSAVDRGRWAQDRRGASARRAPSTGAALGSSGRRYDLDEFVVGDSNRLAHSAAVRAAMDPDAAGFGTLFFHGACGVGKTHLLQGIVRRAVGLRPSTRVRYTTGEQFTNEFIAAVRDRRLDAFRASMRRLELLCIDDVHFLGGKSATQSEFLHTFDALDLGHARVVLASDEHPRRLASFSERLISRCLSGMVVGVGLPDTSTRRQVAERLAASRGLSLEPDAALLLAGPAGWSIRDIEGGVARVEALWRLLPELREQDSGQSRVPPSLVGRALESGTSRRASRPIKLALIVEVVAQHVGVDVSDLLGRGRHQRVVLARSMAAYLARELTTHSFPEIAAALNRPNHSTVVTAYQRVRGQIERGEPCPGDGPEARISAGELCERLRAAVTGASRSAG